MKKREKSVEIGDIKFHKESCCDEKFAQKRNGEQTSEYNTECMLFQYRTKDMKVTQTRYQRLLP